MNGVRRKVTQYEMLEPACDKEIINFYNNKKQKNKGEKAANSDRFTKMMINTKYKIDSKIVSTVKIQKMKHASLMGQVFTSQKEFDSAFHKLIWLSYRRNFAPLLVEKDKIPKLTSDAGWGCVIRCT